MCCRPATPFTLEPLLCRHRVRTLSIELTRAYATRASHPTVSAGAMDASSRGARLGDQSAFSHMSRVDRESGRASKPDLDLSVRGHHMAHALPKPIAQSLCMAAPSAMIWQVCATHLTCVRCVHDPSHRETPGCSEGLTSPVDWTCIAAARVL